MNSIIPFKTLKRLWEHKLSTSFIVVIITSVIEQFSTYHFYLLNLNKVRFYAACVFALVLLLGSRGKVKNQEFKKDWKYSEDYKEFLDFKNYKDYIKSEDSQW